MDKPTISYAETQKYRHQSLNQLDTCIKCKEEAYLVRGNRLCKKCYDRVMQSGK